MVTKERSKAVKISKEIYDVIVALVEQNPTEYPTIKNFIEKAIRDAAGFEKYNLGGLGKIQGKEMNALQNVVGIPSKNFYMCAMCSKFFLKDKNDKTEAAKVCPNCKDAIKHFSHVISDQQKSGGTKK